MADLPPLNYDLSGIDVPGQPRGVSAASQQALDVFRQNAARRAAWQATNGVTPDMLARANSFGTGAAPSVATSAPLGESVAPVATAAAEAAPSFGARVLGGVARFGGKILGPLGALSTGYEIGNTFTPDKVAVGAADLAGTVAKAFGFDNGYAGGSAQYRAAAALPDPAPVVPAPAPGPAPAPAIDSTPQSSRIVSLGPDAANAAARQFFEGNATPAEGTGYIRNNDTGNVMAIDSRGVPNPNFQRVQVPVNVNGEGTGGPAPATPTLGTRGGIFDNLADFARNFGGYALSKASAGGAQKQAARNAELGIKANDSVANRENQAEIARARMSTAAAQLIHDNIIEQQGNRKIEMGLDGNPIVVDLSNPNAPKATKVVPPTKPTLDDFLTGAKRDPRNRGITDAQLKAYYTKTYGG